MKDMWDADKMIIAPDLKVKELMDKGLELDEIIEKGIEKFGKNSEKFSVYEKTDFRADFIDDLQFDIDTLDVLITQWERVDADPKFDRFVEYLQNQIFNKTENPTGKVVVFSESKDTIDYLDKELRSVGRDDMLAISSDNRKKQFETTCNFDANYTGKQSDKFNIIISTDVLAEGVNLHRANVIVNYDTLERYTFDAAYWSC